MTSLLFVILLATPSGVEPAPCEAGRAALAAGDLARAEAAAERCLALGSDDELARSLSLALGRADRHAAALAWADRVLADGRHDVELSLWRVRLLAWTHQRAAARARLDELGRVDPSLFATREHAMLDADLSFWAERWPDADRALTRYLALWPDDADALRKRGLARLGLGERDAARIDLGASCRLGGPGAASCRDLDGVARADATVEGGLEVTGATSPRADELRTTLSSMVRVADPVKLGLAAQSRLRSAGDALASDLLIYLLGAVRGDGWGLEAGAGFGVAAAFSPRLDVFVEPSARLAEGLAAALRVWRLSFADAGATVFAPGVTLELAEVRLDLRYYLAIEDAAGLEHAGLARVRLGGERLWGELGAGVGTARDYVDPSFAQGVDAGHWLALAALGWSPTWAHELRLGYGLRVELGPASSARHELTLAWRVRI
ncbi:MAG: hypothetical protein IT385_04040 [Deltaproteobacteria bacterium]|nr:hypothetical protein [Deltaproteobacteria bacterium]